MRQILVVVAAVSAALGLFPGSPAAQTYVTVTGCDSVAVGFNSFGRLNFAVHNREYFEPVREVAMRPVTHELSSDTCHVILVSAPPGWANANTDAGEVRWYSGSRDSDIPSGGTLDGFRVVLSGSVCCASFILYEYTETPVALERACFLCDLETSARLATWGQLKAIYR
jgi:hypothetical protein